MTANVFSYLVHLPASRWLSEAQYGEFAVVLAWLLVVAVPALAAQAVVAREAVRGVDDASLRRLGIRLTGVVAVAAVVAVPVVGAVAQIGLSTVVPGVLIAPMLTLIATGQGILQGHSRFRMLGVVLAVVGAARSVPMIVAVGCGLGVAGALWAGLGGAAVAAAVVWWLSRSAAVERSAQPPVLWTVVAASQVQLALVVASSLDLLLSRTVLSAADAGVYAVGAVAVKVAFWLPQAVGVVFYPRMADSGQTGRSVRGAATVVAALGAVLIVASILGARLVPILVGHKYDAVVGSLWLFTYTGVALSLLQILLLATIAARRTRWSLMAWAVIGVEALVILRCAHTVTGLIAVAALAASVAALAYAVTFRIWAGPAETSTRTTESTRYDDAGDQCGDAEQPADQRHDPAPDDLRP